MLTLLFFFFAVAIVFSFLCSIWEAVLLSVTPAYAQIKLEEGSAVGHRLQSFKQNIDRPLAAILTLNTFAHTVGAFGVGSQATIIWQDAHPMITAVAIPVGMTAVILVLSEIVPKTLGALYWRTLVPFTTNSLMLVVTLLAPLVWLSQLITRAMKGDKTDSVLSRTDFVALAKIGVKEGVIDPGESTIISNLLEFDDVRAEDIMTPRPVVVAATIDQTANEFHEANNELPFSRIPLHKDDDKDRVVGFLLKDDVLAAVIEGRGDEPLANLKRDILAVAERTSLPVLFTRLLRERAHIALVINEYGGMSGIVTMEDVIETLLGFEIVDETDRDADMQALARRNWERRARSFGLLSEPATEEPAAENPD